MRSRRLILLLACAAGTFAGGPAWALPRTDEVAPAPRARPLVAPPAAWVTAAEIPPAPTGAAGAATVRLLSDSQIHVGDEGFTYYHKSVFKIATVQGLDDSSIQLSWDPALETATFHHIRLLRDGKSIDLLGDGSTMTVARREKDLDRATLDGELTAILQPEGVRVGDVIDYALSVTRRDPAMGGHVEFLRGPQDGVSYGRFRVRWLWPSSRKMHWRALPGVFKPVERSAGGQTELVSDLSNVTTKEPPQGAPKRFTIVNSAELTDFDSWADVARTIYPHYAKAATLASDSPLKAEAARIASLSRDPRVRAEKALALVQDQVRYLLLAMDDGGFIPASADETWARRFGDCKAKTVLLVALLKELGIAARPVLVNTADGNFVGNRLPAMGAFDHVLVQATINGRDYWLDGTRQGDRSLAWLTTPNYEFDLPIVAAKATLVALKQEPLTAPTEAVSVLLDASAGLDAPATINAEIRYHGDLAMTRRLDLMSLSQSDRDDRMRKVWRKRYDFATPDSVTMRDDAATGDFIMSMSGSAKLGWIADSGTRWYEADGARLGWKIDINRDGQLNADAPFAFEHPDWWTQRETIKLPNGGKGFKLQGTDVDETVGDLYTFHRKTAIDGGVMNLEVSTRSLSAELPAAKAAATRSRMAALAEVGVYVRAPDDYVPTDKDLAALKDDKPALAKALLLRGAIQFDAGEGQASMANIDAALAIDPALGAAHAIRAMLLADKEDPAASEVADRAIALNPKSWIAWNAKGYAALNAKDYAKAEESLTKGIAIEEGYTQSYIRRATARLMLYKYAEALADLDAAQSRSPDLQLAQLRAIALQGQHRLEDAIAVLDKLLARSPKDRPGREFRAELLGYLDRPAEARADLDLLIAEKPTVDLYLARAGLADGSAAEGDIAAAIRLDPKSVDALAARSGRAMESGALDAADRDIAAIERIDPGSRQAAGLRMESLIKRGNKTGALKVADSSVAKFGDAQAYNERCWTKATLNVSVDTAMADCEKALILSPGRAATLDSRGFVNLRIGQIDRAIADYDAALKAEPRQAASLFGRGIAYARKGNRTQAIADLAEARRIAPKIEARFATFGVTVPAGFSAQ